MRAPAAMLLLACPPALQAQPGGWLIYFGNVQMNEAWNWHNEVQCRNSDLTGDLEWLLRTGFGYNLTENNNNLLLGYGYVRSETYRSDGTTAEVDEHRIFQQFSTRQSAGRVSLLHRYRFEQRFVGDEFRMRLRYFLLLTVPLTRPMLEGGTVYATAYNELFLNTESPLFDRNRVSAGRGFRFSRTVRAELGSMVQIYEKRSRDQLTAVAFVSL